LQLSFSSLSLSLSLSLSWAADAWRRAGRKLKVRGELLAWTQRAVAGLLEAKYIKTLR